MPQLQQLQQALCRRLLLLLLLPTDDCRKWHKQIYMPHSTSRLPCCLVWHVLRLASASATQGAKRETPTFIWPTRNWCTTSLPHPLSPPPAPHHMINHPIPCAGPVCLSVSLLCLRRTKPTTIALDSFYRCLNCCLCRAWLFAKGRIICPARSVYLLHMLIWLIPSLRIVTGPAAAQGHYNPIDCTAIPLMIFRHFREYFLNRNGLGN